MLAGTPTRKVGAVKVFSTKRACPTCGTSYPELDPRMFSYNSKHGWCTTCVGTGLKLTREQRKAYDDSIRDDDDRGREQSFPAEEAEVEGVVDEPCPECAGTRLNPVSRKVTFEDESIAWIAQLVGRPTRASGSRRCALTGRDAEIARDVVTEIRSRLEFLEEVGLGYLTLDRAAPTLSGGEAQRIRLAAQLGSNLQGVCYVLDEPTIGLHPRDNAILLNALQNLADKGNTLVVVEHDEETIRRADHIIDIGPGAGKRGGRLVAAGQRHRDLVARPIRSPAASSRTRSCTRCSRAAPVVPATASDRAQGERRQRAAHDPRRDAAQPARRHGRRAAQAPGRDHRRQRLGQVDARARRAARQPAVHQHARRAAELAGLREDRRLGLDRPRARGRPDADRQDAALVPGDLHRLLGHDPQALRRDARSRRRAATRRRASASTPARAAAPAAKAQGVKTIEMSFLPDVKVPCDVCHGERFNAETLAVSWRGKSIGDVLKMEVDEAVDFFASMPNIAHPLQLLKDVGLGYLTLGQPSPTLSGGEAQRIKLVTELSKVRDDIGKRGNKAPHTLYVLDEPTVGLHMADVERLIRVLHRLVDGGHSVVVIEHDLDVIAEADWVIDLGPEGGVNGGRVVAEAVPERLIALAESHTGAALRPVLLRHPSVETLAAA